MFLPFLSVRTVIGERTNGMEFKSLLELGYLSELGKIDVA